MGRTSAIPASEEGKGSLFDVMLAHSNEVRWHVLSPAVFSTSAVMPDRETLIQDFMSIATCTPTRDARGHAVFGAAHWPTREEAEKAVDRVTAGAIPASGCSDPVLTETSGAQLPFDLMAS